MSRRKRTTARTPFAVLAAVVLGRRLECRTSIVLPDFDVGQERFVPQLDDIEIGALPNEKVNGKLRKISPKAHKEEGSTLFEVEIAMVEDTGLSVLRAGYSANADIIITRKEDILLIPERLVTMEDSVASVEVQDSTGVIDPREIKTGLSDGINIEVVEGLEEGELLVERPPKEITAE